jgi:hypothetical protein
MHTLITLIYIGEALFVISVQNITHRHCLHFILPMIILFLIFLSHLGKPGFMKEHKDIFIFGLFVLSIYSIFVSIGSTLDFASINVWGKIPTIYSTFIKLCFIKTDAFISSLF